MQPFSTFFTSAKRRRDLLGDRHVLALIEFGTDTGANGVDPRCISVGLNQLGPSKQLEVWRSEAPVESGVRGQVAYSRNDQVLIGHIAIDEREFSDLEAASRHAYETILPLGAEMGFPHYLRIWNYIPNINGEEHGTERYKSFCIGRHIAFEKFALQEHRLPAASGVGTPSGNVLIYFLATRHPGTQVENPRQVSAFRYPSQYGPKSPSFSRAMVKDWNGGKHLYISGTASILGHESHHRDHVTSQLEESLRNMSTLIQGAETMHGVPIHTISELTQIKIYLRDPQYEGIIREHVRAQLGEAAPVIYLCGDLCRTDLLVEVEGLYVG
jgi:chorismate lyase/3-hydroxybenzoate synthase